MVEISSPDDLNVWLRDRPVEWSTVIARRLALRGLPIFNSSRKQTKTRSVLLNRFFIATVRSLLVSEVMHLANDAKVIHAANSSAERVDFILHRTYNADGEFFRKSTAVYITRAANDALYAMLTKGLNKCFLATRATSATLSATKVDFNKPLNSDIQWLEEYNNKNEVFKEFLTLPLWIGRNFLWSDWLEFKAHLLRQNFNWKFWIDWYQSKLDGTLHPGLTQSQQDNLYYKIATFPNELWEDGAEAVNQRIAELLEEIKESAASDAEENSEEPIDLDLPPENSAALRFKTNEDGKVQLAPASEYDKVLTDEGAKARHEETRYNGEELLRLFDPNKPGANAVAPLIEKTQRCLDALGQTPEEVDIDRLIPRGEALRQLAIKEENRDDYTDSPPLPDGFKEALNNLLSAYNPYIALDPVLDKRDQIRLGPDEKGYTITTDEGQAIVDDLADADLLELGTKDILDEVAQTAEGSVDPESRASIYYSESLRNLGRTILSEVDKAKKLIKKKGKVASEVCFDGLVVGAVMIHQDFARKRAQIILKHEKWFVKSFGRTPTMKKMMVGYIHRIKTNPLLTGDDS